VSDVIYAVENEAPLLNLLVWGLRQEGYEAISVPMPGDGTQRFGQRSPGWVIINCKLTPDNCRHVIQAIREAVPRVVVLDANSHADKGCGADQYLPDPYQISDVVKRLGGDQKTARRLRES
jgi:DNA-binding response OmpR family regulator